MYNPKIHHRHSIRLKGYDYSQEGLYYITICTQNREKLFGYIENKKMILNDAGIMVDRIYNKLINYHNMIIDKYIIMPDHFHGIIHIPVGADSISVQNVETTPNPETFTTHNIEITIAEPIYIQHNKTIYTKNVELFFDDKKHSMFDDKKQSMFDDKKQSMFDDKKGADMESAPTCVLPTHDGLSDIIQTFKRFTTIEYIKMVKKNILPPFNKQIWQRNYYEHIIRNSESFKRIRDYIIANPEKWTGTYEHKI